MGEVESGMGTRRRAPQSVGSATAKASTRILVVEDEQDVAELLRYNLTKEGYEVTLVGNGADALKRAREAKPDLILLDIMVPQLNGWEVCRRLRQDPETRAISVIMVTGRVEEGDKVLGFEMGADDYVTKPFSPRELAIRVRNVLKRAEAPDPLRVARTMSFDTLTIDGTTREVTLDGAPVRLTGKEFDLLFFLASNAREVFSRKQLMDRVWGYEAALDTGTVTVHIRRLRSKIETDPSAPRHLETLWGVGYRFVP
jgi:DNA-binding response OmpR family regulator